MSIQAWHERLDNCSDNLIIWHCLSRVQRLIKNDKTFNRLQKIKEGLITDERYNNFGEE